MTEAYAIVAEVTNIRTEDIESVVDSTEMSNEKITEEFARIYDLKLEK